jgi:hypothetical protein
VNLYLRKSDQAAIAEFDMVELKAIQTALGIAERSIGHVNPLVGQIRLRFHALLMAAAQTGAAAGATTFGPPPPTETGKNPATPPAPRTTSTGTRVQPVVQRELFDKEP